VKLPTGAQSASETNLIEQVIDNLPVAKGSAPTPPHAHPSQESKAPTLNAEKHAKEKTMSGDAGKRLPDPPRADFSMPRVLDIEMRATKFEAPRLRNFASSLPSGGDAVEFIVKTDGPIPGRALGPALYLGETPITEVTKIGANTYRFVAPTREGLQQGAPISLGWTGQLPAAVKSDAFRYRL
jgi:hypothetical protein